MGLAHVGPKEASKVARAGAASQFKFPKLLEDLQREGSINQEHFPFDIPSGCARFGLQRY